MKALSSSLINPPIRSIDTRAVLQQKYPAHFATIEKPPAWIQAVLDDINPEEGWHKAGQKEIMTLWELWESGLDLERLEGLAAKQAELDDPDLANMFQDLGFGAGTAGIEGAAEQTDEVWQELFAPAGWDKVRITPICRSRWHQVALYCNACMAG